MSASSLDNDTEYSNNSDINARHPSLEIMHTHNTLLNRVNQ